MPAEDNRFAQDSINRWFCRHVLTTVELDMLHEGLIKYGGAGRRLDMLTKEVIHLHPDSTDVQARLQTDERFIYLDGIWFSRQAAYYSLTPEDVERIYGILAAQADHRAAVPLKDLVNQAIGHDGRFTDAADWLHQDERFKEIHKGFWALNSSPAPDFGRSGPGGVAVHHPSDGGDIVSDGSSSTDGKLTLRKGRSATVKVGQEPQKKAYIVLTHLDILHGNLRIAGLLKKWIPVGVDNIHCIDEEDYEFIAYIDETGSILNIREWLEYRRRTYGDKISIQPASQVDGLLIRPYGNRDERVYQEAIEHQEIEKLITEARRVNKDFHDLMIEVMEEYNLPLHREDIYQLVNYLRTASRNTISEILSMPDCPYEELRYFIPVGAGSWKFDRTRKEAYDMKMQELLTENGVLQNQLESMKEQLQLKPNYNERIKQLNEQVENFQTLIAETNDKVVALSEENSRLHEQLTNLLSQIDTQKDTTKEDALRKELKDLQEKYTELIEKFEHIFDEKTEFERTNSELQIKLETLEKQTGVLLSSIQENETAMKQIQDRGDQELKQLREHIDTLNIEITSLKTKLNDRQKLTASEKSELGKAIRDNLQQEIEQLNKEYSAKTSKLEADLANAQSANEEMHKYIQEFGDANESKLNQLKENLEEATNSNERMQEEIKRLNDEGIGKTEKLDAFLAAARAKVESLQSTINQLNDEKAEIKGKLEAQLASSGENEKNLRNEIDQVNQESIKRNNQLQAEVDKARARMAEAQQNARQISSSKFQKFIQGISKIFSNKKS
jgi:predicted  nucleic acid-binding Zn-ribbon protein